MQKDTGFSRCCCIKTSLVNLFVLLFVLLMASTAWAQRTTTFYHTDAAGSVIAASDEAGQLLWRKNYTPYGEKHTDGEGESPSLAYTGKPHDDTTGLTYMGARYYDPVVGRFMGIDAVGFDPDNPLSFNRYAYANNNPYKYIDPDDNLPFLIPLAIFAAKEIAASKFEEATGLPALFSVKGAAKFFGKKLTKTGAKEVTKGGGKADFIVSPKGTTMPTNKVFNLVDSNKKGGDWFQIHNKHTDAKVEGSPHTHYPKQHSGSRTREIK